MRRTVSTLLWFIPLAVGGLAVADGSPRVLSSLVKVRRAPEPVLAAAPAPVPTVAPAAGAPVTAAPAVAPAIAAAPVTAARPPGDAADGGPMAIWRHEAPPASATPAPTATPTAPAAAPAPPGQEAPREIEDPCLRPDEVPCRGRAMDGFYRALARADRKEGLVRVAHFGDSIVAYDNVSSRLRDRLQQSFGDGGAGFVYIANPSRWYLRTGLRYSTRNWSVRSVTGTWIHDKLYGLGGASFLGSSEDDARTFVGTRPVSRLQAGTRKDAGSGHGSMPLGAHASRFELYYFAQPAGGTVQVTVDGKEHHQISTRAEMPASRRFELALPDAPHTLTVRPDRGRVRLFGVVLERDSGVVLDNLGLVSANGKSFSLIEPLHWQEQLRFRGVDLGIFFFGTNEAGYTGAGEKAIATYQENFERTLARFRAARPQASCLVMSPLDAAIFVDGQARTKPALQPIVLAQRRAALAKGCAFWSTFDWMGGKGAIVRWFKKGLAALDYAHPTRAGGDRVADALFEALRQGCRSFAARHPQAGSRACR